jgi:BlaI family penicillinase repressor
MPSRISEAEWEVMLVLWNQSPASEAEIVERLTVFKGWSSSTVRTLLRRLVKKGAVAVDPRHRPHQYKPKVSRAECVQRESESFLRRVFDGEPASMLLHFAERASLSADDVERLKRMLSKKAK